MNVFRNGISRRFVLVISLVFTAIIIFLTFFFNYILTENYILLRGVVLNNNERLQRERVQNVAALIASRQVRRDRDISGAIRSVISPGSGFLNVIVFSQTADENFFRVKGGLQLHPGVQPGPEENTVVRENRDSNYLKKGMFRTVVDPEIYSAGGVFWQNVYQPFTAGGRHYVLQFMISASRTMTALNEYSDAMKRLKWYLIFIDIAAVIIVLFVVLHFMQNFSLLIGNISRSMKKASEGELDVNMNAEADRELAELAVSFNSLIEEMKGLREKGKQFDEMEKFSMNDIFKTGVACMKEERLDEAVALFRSLLIFNPESFGGLFNLGVAYAKQREYNESLSMFLRARDLNPEHEMTRSYIDKVQRLQAKYDSEQN